MPKMHPLKAYRRAEGITLEQVAEASGTTKGTISRIESGNGLSLALLGRIVAACRDSRVTAETLMGSVRRSVRR
jgi:transcriptional regulator with XRE-family HTH domain